MLVSNLQPTEHVGIGIEVQYGVDRSFYLEFSCQLPSPCSEPSQSFQSCCHIVVHAGVSLLSESPTYLSSNLLFTSVNTSTSLDVRNSYQTMSIKPGSSSVFHSTHPANGALIVEAMQAHPIDPKTTDDDHLHQQHHTRTTSPRDREEVPSPHRHHHRHHHCASSSRRPPPSSRCRDSYTRRVTGTPRRRTCSYHNPDHHHHLLLLPHLLPPPPTSVVGRTRIPYGARTPPPPLRRSAPPRSSGSGSRTAAACRRSPAPRSPIGCRWRRGRGRGERRARRKGELGEVRRGMGSCRRLLGAG